MQTPGADALKPAWLQGQPYQAGYYTGIGHSRKDGANNYVQMAKKSALDDLVSQIKVTVASTSVLSTFENNQKFREEYEQIVKTTAADEIEEFELVGAWEDVNSYWVYYRLSIARYQQIKEEQKRNATILATDFFLKGKAAEEEGQLLEGIGYYFQAFRSIEKYLGEAIRVTLHDREILLVNEIYASIQRILQEIRLEISPAQLTVNRRLAQSQTDVTVRAVYRDNTPVKGLPLKAVFEKGGGIVFPEYITNEAGEARVLITRIDAMDSEQRIGVTIDVDRLSAGSTSPVYALVATTLRLPRAHVLMKIQRPVVYLTSLEQSFGSTNDQEQIANRLKSLLVSNGFEFTHNKGVADLWLDVHADSRKGSVSGSIYITHLSGVIRVMAVNDGTEIYTTTLDGVKGYGLDYTRSSADAYNKALEVVEGERLKEMLSAVLQ